MGGLLLICISVAMARLAGNTVPITHAGVAEVRVKLTTGLTGGDGAKVYLAQENAQSYYKFQQLRAKLMHSGHPVSGAPVRFVVGRHLVCSEITNASGIAVCDNSARHSVDLFTSIGEPRSYTATFDGLGPFQLSRGTGELRPIGDGNAGDNLTETPDTVE